MAGWLTPALLFCFLWPWTKGQDEQVCRHMWAEDYMYIVQCFGLNASNAYQLELVMADVRARYPLDRLRVEVSDSVGDAIPDDVFHGFVIETLKMNNCGFTSVPFRLITNMTPYLTMLDLGYNQIVSIDFQLLNELPYAPNLIYLKFYGNQIASLQEDAFVNFTKLIVLDLKDNSLTELEDDTFREMAGLQGLYLLGNQIGAVGSEAFAGLGSLSLLALETNKINFLENGTFTAENQTSLAEIALEGNPFHCNCSLQWLKDYLTSIHYLKASGATCVYPQIAKFSEIDFCVEEETNDESTLMPETRTFQLKI